MGYLQRTFEATEDENRRVILSALQPQPGATLVDLGCGDGRWTLEVARRIGGARTIGVELIKPLADAAEANGVEVLRASLAEPLPLDDHSVDVVHSNQVIEHLVGTDLFLSEIKRILRPGGHAVVSTNNIASLHNIVCLFMGWQPTPMHVSDEVIVGNPMNFADGHTGAAGQMHLRIFTGRALAELASHHGLAVELDRTAGYYPFGPRLARVLTAIDRRHGAFLVQRYRA
jgi:SAM-dependent methyltransferase